MSSAATSTQKSRLRLEARRIFGVERDAATGRVARTLLALPELVGRRTIAVYAAIDDEVPLYDVGAAVVASGGRVLYPVKAGSDLELAVVDDVHPLEPGRGRLREPVASARRVAAHEVDAYLVPGLLFDRAGRRLGRGGGHYDRLLSRARPDAALIGICYAERVVDELPQDSWDISMNVVVTERFVLRFASYGPSR